MLRIIVSVVVLGVVGSFLTVIGLLALISAVGNGSTVNSGEVTMFIPSDFDSQCAQKMTDHFAGPFFLCNVHAFLSLDETEHAVVVSTQTPLAREFTRDEILFAETVLTAISESCLDGKPLKFVFERNGDKRDVEMQSGPYLGTPNFCQNAIGFFKGEISPEKQREIFELLVADLDFEGQAFQVELCDGAWYVRCIGDEKKLALESGEHWLNECRSTAWGLSHRVFDREPVVWQFMDDRFQQIFTTSGAVDAPPTTEFSASIGDFDVNLCGGLPESLAGTIATRMVATEGELESQLWLIRNGDHVDAFLPVKREIQGELDEWMPVFERMGNQIYSELPSGLTLTFHGTDSYLRTLLHVECKDDLGKFVLSGEHHVYYYEPFQVSDAEKMVKLLYSAGMLDSEKGRILELSLDKNGDPAIRYGFHTLQPEELFGEEAKQELKKIGESLLREMFPESERTSFGVMGVGRKQNSRFTWKYRQDAAEGVAGNHSPQSGEVTSEESAD